MHTFFLNWFFLDFEFSVVVGVYVVERQEHGSIHLLCIWDHKIRSYQSRSYLLSFKTPPFPFDPLFPSIAETMKRHPVYAFFCGILLALSQARAFSAPSSKFFRGTVSFRRSSESKFERSRGLLGTATNNIESEAAATDATSSPTILKSYEYDGWNLTYRTIAEDETEKETSNDHHNVLLIHPVGIGLASWFWEPLLSSLRDKNKSNGSTPTTSEQKTKIRAYAPNLIGCGISEGSDAWDPDQRGMFVPLGWVKGCEALMREIDDRDRDRDEKLASSPQKWTVVTQGGLAPIGVLLAARNPESVSELVLASPPTWEDMTIAVPQEELERNYGFLRSPILGKLAFSILETRGLVEFFSNQFLFTPGKGCDDAWLDNTEREMCVEARPPVQNFNAGICMNRGLGPELTETIQSEIPSVLVVQGENDKRPREEYEQIMKNCRLVTVPGSTNVIPWERPEAFADILADII